MIEPFLERHSAPVMEDPSSVMEPTSPTPEWVYKRDGRLVPFAPDQISRGLFAATETLKQPNAFLARELTDAVVHFGAAEWEGTIPTTAQVADLVVKVVRELGQAPLAQAFVQFSQQRLARERTDTPLALGPSLAQLAEWMAHAPEPMFLARRLGGWCLRDYSLREVFARDLAAAHAEGLLTLTGLETPLELAACTLGPPQPRGLMETIDQARNLAGDFLALDSPDHALAQASPEQLTHFVRELKLGLRATGLRAVVNLHGTTPPSWADDLAEGPLFAAERLPVPGHLDDLGETLRDHLLEARSTPEAVRVDWHLATRDFTPAAENRLLSLARRALDGSSLALVYDRPRRPLVLAEGLTRRHGAVLLKVGLHLPRLAEQTGLTADPAMFVKKLGSLARMALSAGTQKRDFLRRHARSWPAFLLDRARLVVTPIGLDAAVRQLHGAGICEKPEAQAFGRHIIERLGAVLREDKRTGHLESCLDSGNDWVLNGQWPEPTQVAGLTAWDEAAPLKNQLRAAGFLHAAADMGTAAILISDERPPTPEEVVHLLRFGWQQTDLVRVMFVRVRSKPRQLPGPWEEKT